MWLWEWFLYNLIPKKLQYLLNMFKNTLEVDLGIFSIYLKSMRLETGYDPIHICIVCFVCWMFLDAWHALSNSLSCCAFIFIAVKKCVILITQSLILVFLAVDAFIIFFLLADERLLWLCYTIYVGKYIFYFFPFKSVRTSALISEIMKRAMLKDKQHCCLTIKLGLQLINVFHQSVYKNIFPLQNHHKNTKTKRKVYFRLPWVTSETYSNYYKVQQNISETKQQLNEVSFIQKFWTYTGKYIHRIMDLMYSLKPFMSSPSNTYKTTINSFAFL